MSKTRVGPGRSRPCLVVAVLAILGALLVCGVVVALLRRAAPSSNRDVTLEVAISADKQALFEEIVTRFNEAKPRLQDKRQVRVVATVVGPKKMIVAAAENQFQAVSPDSSLWLQKIDRYWMDMQQGDTTLAGEPLHYMVSPVVIAMWPDVASRMGYPEKDLGWADLQSAAEADPSFKWSHPSTDTASGLLATLAAFYTGAGVTRGLTEEMVRSPDTLDYVIRLERTVRHYGEDEQVVMAQVEEQGRGYLDAFVMQEQLVIQHNLTSSDDLLAIYPREGTLWKDHPLALLEHAQRSDEERQAFQLFSEYLLAGTTQELILSRGYRPGDLTIPLDGSESPIRPEHGVDPAQPYTTLQIPSPSVMALVQDLWLLTKRAANVLLVVDVSGSMAGDKLADAEVALHRFLDQMESSTDRVGLIAFSSGATQVVQLGELGQTRATLARAIDELNATGNTALLDGVALALDELQDRNESERINAIVVMTDGRENASRIRRDQVVARIEALNDSEMPVLVFCVAYGWDADLQVLQSLSGAAEGFTRQGDLDTIEALYEALSTYF